MRLFFVLIRLAIIGSIGLIIAPVSAYLDPGTGSMLLQTLIAILMGMTITIKVYWQRIKDFFMNR